MENKEIRIRAAVIITKGDRILLAKHQKYGREYWLIPGGGVEFGETIEDAAIRELKEEANLDVKITENLFLVETIPPDLHRHVINIYLAGEILGGELKVGKDDVLCDMQFLPIESIPELIMYPPMNEEIYKYLKGDKSVIGKIYSPPWKPLDL